MHGLVREWPREFPVTARVTTLRGPDAGAYYVEQLGSYYLDGDEPPGRWHGRGAAELGLAREIDEDAFLALMDGLDPTTGRALGSAHSERTVRGFDVTFSAPKSLSVLYAVGGEEVCHAVLAGHDERAHGLNRQVGHPPGQGVGVSLATAPKAEVVADDHR